MVSDDTEHTVFVAQCLAANPRDAEEFQRLLAWKFRWWLLCLPAGVGFATLRSILKLWVGFSVHKSGVFSAGNGPAMRSAVLGAKFSEDPDKLSDYVRASTRLTHSDPRAETAALAVALTAAWAVNNAAEEATDAMCALWRSAGPLDEEWQALLDRLCEARRCGCSVAEFATALGLQWGVGGYAYHTVPVALYVWLRHGRDFRACLEAVLNCGGDTDTVAAIAGALATLRGPIPPEWLGKIRDFPISVAYLRKLTNSLETSTRPPYFAWPLLPVRNLAFLAIVLAHGFRRLIPI